MYLAAALILLEVQNPCKGNETFEKLRANNILEHHTDLDWQLKSDKSRFRTQVTETTKSSLTNLSAFTSRERDRILSND